MVQRGNAFDVMRDGHLADTNAGRDIDDRKRSVGVRAEDYVLRELGDGERGEGMNWDGE